MKNSLFFLSVLGMIFSLRPVPAQINLRYENDRTLTYDEVIAAYTYLERHYPQARLIEVGETDAGKPLHLFIINRKQEFNPEQIGRSGVPVVMINNGIHPGEPPGIDASIMLARDILAGKDDMNRFAEKMVVAIIPVYNVGGSLNRSPYHRANQETPPESGFRGNARNLDLNRDFMKADSKNAHSLEKVFTLLHPLVFLDTHVTNGSDHQYAITLIPTVYQKMVPEMGTYFHQKMVPALFTFMKNSPWEMIPYVQSVGRTPASGIASYNDLPRVSTGYASLFNVFAFMTENHVYKPFSQQVLSVYTFMTGLLDYTYNHAEEMTAVRDRADRYRMHQQLFVLRWQRDTSSWSTIPFKGYALSTFRGEATNMEYTWYDRSKPYTKMIRFYEGFMPSDTVIKPDAYLIPQAWREAVEHLKINHVRMFRLSRDTMLRVPVKIITNVDFSRRPYNGHFQHHNVRYRIEEQLIRFYAGDYYIPLNQYCNRYLIEALEPDADDSWFSWNFFDGILDQREYFSPSTFEKKAAAVLQNDPVLESDFRQRVASDSAFAANRYLQLRYIYDHSPYHEKSYRRYPVYSIFGNPGLPVIEDVTGN